MWQPTRVLGEIGCPTWNRTKIYGFRVRRATFALQGKIGAGLWRYGFTDCGNPACCSPCPVALTPFGAKVWLAKNDPATGAAPVWVSLQKRCLCCSAKPAPAEGSKFLPHRSLMEIALLPCAAPGQLPVKNCPTQYLPCAALEMAGNAPA